MFTDITAVHKNAYNDSVNHPLQSFEWGEFRQKTGVQVVRRGKLDGKKVIDGYTMTLHKVPKLPYTIGYLPKGTLPTKELISDLVTTAKKYNCVYVQLEPDVLAEKGTFEIEQLVLDNGIKLKPSFHPLFTKYTFVLNLTPTEEELLSKMHPKTRYNIRVAQKHGVTIHEDQTETGFNEFMKLYEETTTRQKFYAHTPSYHRNLWSILTNKDSSKTEKSNLGYHLVHAKLGTKTLASWVLFSFHDILYYPYGASSRENREAMASNLIMWESIKMGKRLKLKQFDMWGALSENPDTTDPWYGFHKFKQGYGATLTEFAGSYDLIINPVMYEFVKVGDKLRWGLLKLRKRI